MANNQIKKCVSCPVAHKFISEYSLYWNTYQEVKKSKGKDRKALLKLKETIDNLSEILLIEGTYKEKKIFLNRLINTNISVDELYPELSEISDCVRSINKIVSSLKIFFVESEYPFDEITDIPKFATNNLCCLSDFLLENNIKTETLTTEEKSWDKDYLNTLGFTTSEDGFEDDPTEEEIEKALSTYNKFRKIVMDYCQSSTGEISYKYCSPIFNKDKSLMNCQSNSLNMLSETNNSLGIKLFRLNDTYRSVVYNYLEKAPKKFSDVLTRVMEHQNLGYTEVAKLWNNEKKHASSVQKLTTSDNNKLTDEDKKTLQKILLVSEDMLICGSGRIYGNWNDVLKKQTDPEESKILLESYGEKKYIDTKSKIRDDIIELINNDEKFEEARKTSDFFCDDYLCVYTCIDDYSNELCYDYNAMYENLLHPEDFDTLLSVLEELQAQEKNW